MHEENFLDNPDVHDLANDLFTTCMFVQFLGVSAAVAAFFAFIKDNSILVGGRHFWICISPLLMAYLPIFIYFIVSTEFKRQPKKVLWFCWWVYFSDALFLGCLVWFSGGPSNSYFTPLFLLIPSAASCFSIPKKRPFWILTFTVLAVYLGVMYSENFFHNGSAIQYDIFYFIRLLLLNLFDVTANIESLKFDFVKGGRVLAGIFTLLCIATAAFCYWKTYSIKNGFLEKHKENALKMVKEFYI